MKKTWNEIFKEFLDQQDITKSEASKITKIPYSTMCAYLSGSRKPSDTNKEVIRKKLKFDIYNAMYGEHYGKN